jgi:hypothetical protein
MGTSCAMPENATTSFIRFTQTMAGSSIRRRFKYNTGLESFTDLPNTKMPSFLNNFKMYR